MRFRSILIILSAIFMVGCEDRVETAHIPVFESSKSKIIEYLDSHSNLIDSYKFVPFSNVPDSHKYVIGYMEIKSSHNKALPPREVLDAVANTIFAEAFPTRNYYWKRKGNPVIYQDLARALRELEQEPNPKHVLVTDYKVSVYYK